MRVDIIEVCLFASGVVALVILAGCSGVATNEPTDNGLGAAPSQYHARHYRDSGLQGVTQFPGITIYWKGNTSNGASVAEVVDVAVERMQFEQSTDLASDSNAQALALLLQARSVLNGSTRTTEDGLPILE